MTLTCYLPEHHCLPDVTSHTVYLLRTSPTSCNTVTHSYSVLRNASLLLYTVAIHRLCLYSDRTSGQNDCDCTDVFYVAFLSPSQDKTTMTVFENLDDEALYKQLDLQEFEQTFSAYQHKEDVVDSMVTHKAKVPLLLPYYSTTTTTSTSIPLLPLSPPPHSYHLYQHLHPIPTPALSPPPHSYLSSLTTTTATITAADISTSPHMAKEPLILLANCD